MSVLLNSNGMLRLDVLARKAVDCLHCADPIEVSPSVSRKAIGLNGSCAHQPRAAADVIGMARNAQHRGVALHCYNTCHLVLKVSSPHEEGRWSGIRHLRESYRPADNLYLWTDYTQRKASRYYTLWVMVSGWLVFLRLAEWVLSATFSHGI